MHAAILKLANHLRTLVRRFERTPACCHFIDDASEGPYVALISHTSDFKLNSSK